MAPWRAPALQPTAEPSSTSAGFVFYGLIPLAFGVANPEANAVAAATLLAAFVGTVQAFSPMPSSPRTRPEKHGLSQQVILLSWWPDRGDGNDCLLRGHVPVARTFRGTGLFLCRALRGDDGHTAVCGLEGFRRAERLTAVKKKLCFRRNFFLIATHESTIWRMPRVARASRISPKQRRCGLLGLDWPSKGGCY